MSLLIYAAAIGAFAYGQPIVGLYLLAGGLFASAAEA
jgi:hypothetical protein